MNKEITEFVNKLNVKENLLIFSQCFIYGGSERLMYSIYGSEAINEAYDVTFAYSYFRDYKDGLNLDNQNGIKKARFDPLFLLTNGPLFNKINLKIQNKPIRRIIKLPLFLIEWLGLYAIFNAFYLFFYLLKKRPQVVHINNGGYPAARACNVLAIVLLLFKVRKVIYQVNNQAVLKKNIPGRIKDHFVNKRVDFFLTHSTQNYERLIARGFPSHKMVQFYSFYKDPLVLPQQVKNKSAGIEFTMCSVGQLSWRKGQLFMLKLVVLIRERNPSFYERIKLNLIGEGDSRFELELFISSNGIGDKVKLWGNRTDYQNFIKESDVFLLTSVEGEDLPLVLITAMQEGKCVVASRFAAIGELLTSGWDAFLVEPDSSTFVEDIYNCVHSVYADASLKEQLQKNILETYIKKLGKEKYERSLLALYSKLKLEINNYKKYESTI